ncbi:MAG TPA: M20/M25/M40 family metallo-hydrolase [Syntrophorhabdaceae bacterium]|jgi:acetylornithine deacetylase/succinyl-diaminopimelate desuccinylase-like protein
MKELDLAVSLLQQFIRINTTNPPGNEEEAILFLEALLKEAGIDSQIYEAAAKRANLLARIPGKQKGKPIILLSHVDVVAAHEDEWEVDPFGGVLKDGYIYGRGAIDMKSQTICQLLAFMALRKEGITPERDILFLATGDEEVGGKFGAEDIIEKAPELKTASFVLSEGGWITEEAGVLHAQISVAEKSLAQFFIRADGIGGHGSMPRKENANEKIIEAARSICAFKWPFKETRIVKAYMDGIFKGRKGKGFTYRTLKDALSQEGFRRFAEDNPVYNSLLRNTIALTVLRGGEKVNVIPSESSAYFDARLLPGENYARFMKKVVSLAGRKVQVVPISGGDAEPVPSGYDTPYFKAIAKVMKSVKTPVPLLPFITTGATDLRYFRRFGAMAYGFFPVTLPEEELFRMHGVNERLSITCLEEGLIGMKAIVKELSTLA